MIPNLKVLSLAVIAVCAGVLGWSAVYEQPFSEKSVLPKSLQVGGMPEMDALEFTEGWELRVEMNNVQKGALKKEWEASYEDVRKFLTPERVKQMSRWSRDKMKNYRYVSLPKPEKCEWKTLCHDAAGTCFLMETTLETLPSDPGMRRDLRAWVLYDTQKKKLRWILVTIRSELVREEKKRFLWW